jgi:hypothetical protein
MLSACWVIHRQLVIHRKSVLNGSLPWLHFSDTCDLMNKNARTWVVCQEIGDELCISKAQLCIPLVLRNSSKFHIV